MLCASLHATSSSQYRCSLLANTIEKRTSSYGLICCPPPFPYPCPPPPTPFPYPPSSPYPLSLSPSSPYPLSLSPLLPLPPFFIPPTPPPTPSLYSLSLSLLPPPTLPHAPLCFCLHPPSKGNAVLHK